jgi:cytochrome c553
MQIAVQSLGDEALVNLAREFGRENRPARRQGRDEPPVLIEAGDPDRKVPPCAACHGMSVPARPDFPALNGQDRRYLALQLHIFAGDATERGGGPFRALMQIAGHGLEPDQIMQAAEWYGAAD